MDIKILMLLYGCVLLLNLLYCGLLWLKTKEMHYRVQSLAYFYFTVTLVLQILAVNGNYLLKALSGSSVFLGLLAFTKLVNVITKSTFAFKKFLVVYLSGIALTTILFLLDVDYNWMALPCIMGAVYPLLSTAYRLIAGETGLTFATKCFLWSGVIYSFHMLDYAYAIDKPELAILGFSFAVICILAFNMFSNAAVMESILIENTKIKLLIQYQAMLTNSSKLASLGEMAGGVAHEINNPLAVIQLNSDALKRAYHLKDFDQATGLRRIDAIVESVNRIVKVITNLRYFSRDSSHDPLTETSIQTVIEQTLSFCKVRFMESGVEILSGEIPDIKVLCRPGQLAQALLNILNNSFEAVVKNSIHEKFIRIDVRIRGQETEIRVTDSGPGIPQNIRHQIFDPFFTTKDIGEGMGLGLSVSMGMIEAQNGHLKLDESLKQTCFVIQLPNG